MYHKCASYCTKFGLTFNKNKSKIMFFLAQWRNKAVYRATIVACGWADGQTDGRIDRPTERQSVGWRVA